MKKKKKKQRQKKNGMATISQHLPFVIGPLGYPYLPANTKLNNIFMFFLAIKIDIFLGAAFLTVFIILYKGTHTKSSTMAATRKLNSRRDKPATALNRIIHNFGCALADDETGDDMIGDVRLMLF